MKKNYTFILLLFVVTLAQAQIPNAGFENWTGNTPDGWSTTNQLDYTYILQSGNAHTGAYAVRFNTLTVDGYTAGGYLTSGDSGSDGYFPVATLPDSLYGWYIGYPADTGDELTISSTTGAGGQQVGLLAGGAVEATTVYKQFAVGYSSHTGGTGPDSVRIQFSIQNQTGRKVSDSTYFILDDLSFTTTATGITPVNDGAVLELCGPNPAAYVANIIYSLTGNSAVNLDLHDVQGDKVKALLNNLQQTPGRYKIPVDVSGLPNGVYLYCLHVNGQAYTQKIVVAK